MGSSILDMLFRLDLSLLKVIFIYTIKMSEKGIFILSVHMFSFQLVTGLPDSTKDATKGCVIVSGPWANLLEHQNQEFKPRHSLAIPGRIDPSPLCFILVVLLIMGLLLMFIALRGTEKKKRGRLVEWVEKAFFDQLNKLFVISANKWHYQTLLTYRNLLAMVQESQLYVFPILPHLIPKVLVPGEHHILKDLPFYEEGQATNAKARQDRLDQREKKR